MTAPASQSLHQPRQLLVNDEGNAAVHFVDLDSPERSWSYRGPGRDLQVAFCAGNYDLLAFIRDLRIPNPEA